MRGKASRRLVFLCAALVVAGLLFLYLQVSRQSGSEEADALAVSFQAYETSLPTSYVYADKMPAYQGEDMLVLNKNRPNFTEQDLMEIYLGEERFEGLDELGRCRGVIANLDASMIPTAEREGIGDVRPSGWHTVKYPELIEDNYLYNRCHLIAFALTGRNADINNLVTGTRHLNKDLMLEYEIAAIRYLESSPRNRLMYRVTPYYYKDELVCRGIEMEAYSMNDDGRSLSYHVFLYNVQPGIEIDYATGDSWERE